MFPEHGPLNRIKAAKDAGFDSIEWLFPYDQPIDAIANALSEHNVRLILVNTALGDPSRRDRGIGAIPDRTTDFQEAFRQTIQLTDALSVPYIHVMAGIVPSAEERNVYVDTFCRNLDWAANEIEDRDAKLLIEPLNTLDSPGYLHSNTTQAMEIIELVDRRVGLQYDFYHMQLMEGNLAATVERLLPEIDHIQFSSVPGRHEPQYGEVNLPYLFDRLDDLEYSGYVGCEYRPKTSTKEGLLWLQEYQDRVNTIPLDG